MSNPLVDSFITGVAQPGTSVTVNKSSAGSNRVAFALCFSLGAGQTCTGVARDPTGANEAFTAVDSQADPGTFQLSLWILKNPPTAANDYKASFSGSANQTLVLVMVKDANQTTTLGTPVKASGTSNTPAVSSIGSATGKLVLGCYESGNVNGRTVDGTDVAEDGIFPALELFFTKPGAASVSFSWPQTNSAVWAAIGVSVNEVSSVSISVSDTGTPTESVSVTTSDGGGLAIAVVDTPSPSEVVSFTLLLSVVVSDTGTPTESVTTSSSGPLSVVVSDTGTPTESVTTLVSGPRTIAVVDTPSPSELVALHFTDLSAMASDTLFDSAPPTEFIAIQMQATGGPRASDDDVAGESVSIQLSIGSAGGPSVFDTSAPGEFVTLRLNKLQMTLVDIATPTDFIAVQLAGLLRIREIGLAGNTQYDVRIRAFNRAGLYSPWSPTVSGFTVEDTTSPQIPTGLQVSPGPGRTVQIIWDRVTAIDAAAYRLYRSPVNNPSLAPLLVRVQSLQYVDMDPLLAVGTTYYYWVASEDRTGNISGFSSVASITVTDTSGDTTPPASPASISATSVAVMTSDGTVTIAMDIVWSGVVDTDLDFYDIQFKRQADTVWTIRQILSGVTTFRELGVIGNTTYDLQARAVDRAGNRSAFTIGSHLTVADTTPPDVPTGVSATGGFKIVALAWVPPSDPDFDQIEVWRSTTNNSVTAAKVGQTRATVYVDEQLANGTQYFYWLKARDFSGNVSAFHTGQTNGVIATTVVIGASDVVTASALLTTTAQITDAIISAAKIISLNADKIVAGTIGAQLIKLGANQFELDGSNVYLRILDTQGTPITRVKLGKLGATSIDYGIEVYGVDGAVQFRADGLQIAGLGRDAGIQASLFAYYHAVIFGSGSPRESWRTAADNIGYVVNSADTLEYDVLFEGTTDIARTIGGLDLACIERGPENAQAVSSTTLTLNAGALSTDSIYNNMWIEILSNGTPAANGQAVPITAYVGSSQIASVTSWPGGTPTGTISYRLIRRLAEDGGNDQNGLSSQPDTALGQRALNQWYHRVITLPSAWTGKNILSAATAMQGGLTSTTQIMLIKNAKITAAAVPRALISRFGLVTQSLWLYGTEANATVTVRRESLASMAPPEAIMDNAVSRAGLVTTTGISYTGIAETVVATFSNVVFLISTEDAIRSWVQWATQQSGSFQTGSIFVRIRRNSLTGPIIFSQEIIIVVGTKTGGSSVIGGGAFMDFTIESPGVTGFVSYVLTIEAPNNTQGWPVTVDKLKMLQIAKSK